MIHARRAASFSLDSVPVIPLDAVLVRCVPQIAFNSGRPPSYFFVSGHARRLNPEGVECLYFSEDEVTANLEYGGAFAGTPAVNQPKVTYKARVRLRGALDLGDAVVRKTLRITSIDLVGPWRGKKETLLQTLGRAISGQSRVAAVRFPSARAEARGQKGWNIAVFIAALGRDDRLEILGPGDKPIEVFAAPTGRLRK